MFVLWPNKSIKSKSFKKFQATQKQVGKKLKSQNMKHIEKRRYEIAGRPQLKVAVKVQSC